MEMISRRFAAVAVAVALACSASVALARPRPGGGRRFEANKTFGLGLMIGAPTGLSGKYFVQPDRAIDFGIGAIYFDDRYGNGFHVHGDYLWHPVSIAHTDAFELPFYLGVGARVFTFGCDGCSGATALGVRVPFGLSMDFNEVPIDIFFELVFVADIYVDYPGHSLGPDLDGSLGIRYWFD